MKHLTQKSIIKKFVLAILFLVSLGSCKTDGKVNKTHLESDLITVDKVQSYIDNPSTIFIDVRTPKEISNGKIANSLEINFRDDNFKEQINKLDKSKEYIIYCRSGGRSANAYAMMKDLGFTKIKDLDGGYNAYKASIN